MQLQRCPLKFSTKFLPIHHKNVHFTDFDLCVCDFWYLWIFRESIPTGLPAKGRDTSHAIYICMVYLWRGGGHVIYSLPTGVIHLRDSCMMVPMWFWINLCVKSVDIKKLECGTWYHHPRRLQCVLSRNLRTFKVSTWHYRCHHNLKNNCIWDHLQYCLLGPRSPSKPVMLTFDMQSRKMIFIEIVSWHV